MAALLLEDDGSPAPAGAPDLGMIPQGETIMMQLPKKDGDKKDENKDAKSANADTSSAAAGWTVTSRCCSAKS